MGLRIVKPGMSLSLQDAGRRGHRALGVPLSGPMDPYSYRLANILCRNDPGFAALELTLHGTVMMVEADLYLAHVGGGSQLHINGEPVPTGRACWVRAFSLLEFRASKYGCRSYLATPGGFAARSDLGSGSTYEPACLGGMEGRYLRTGDLLVPNETPDAKYGRTFQGIVRGDRGWGIARWGIPTNILGEMPSSRIRVLYGPEWTVFPPSSREAFFSYPYQVTQDSSRMGFRLLGPPLNRNVAAEMLSTAVCPGTVQVTHDGMPVLLMSDAQTVGGYPRIASVFSADLARCGQLRPGDYIHFVPGTMAEAEAASEMHEKLFKEIERSIRIRFDT